MYCYKKKIFKYYINYCCYYCDALEVTNVDGYKVSIEKEEE